MTDVSPSFPETESFLVGIPTPEEAELLLESPDARAIREAAQSALLPPPTPGKMAHGRQRESLVEDPSQPPETIPEFVVVQLGRRLDAEKLPIRDQFTKFYGFSKPEDYLWYISAPPRKNKDRGAALEADPTRELRQLEHVPDRVQREVRDNMRLAYLRHAALRATRFAIRQQLDVLPETPAHFAAGAIEDMAFGLRDQRNRKFWNQIRYAGDLDVSMEHVGLHAAQNPDDLRRHDLVLKLVLREQAKRGQYWRSILDRILSVDIDRSDTRDREDGSDLAEMIGQFGVYSERDEPRIS